MFLIYSSDLSFFYLFIYLPPFLTLSHVILISSLAVIASPSFAFEVAVPCMRILTVWQKYRRKRVVKRREKEGKALSCIAS